MEEPVVQVGILSRPEVDFILRGLFRIGDAVVSGSHTICFSQGKVLWDGTLYSELYFEPSEPLTDSFELCEVTIGIHFHWERRENQCFRGALHVLTEGDQLTFVNVVSVEEYLTSVISSEMSATASLSLLKAHAVISRSWLFAQMGHSVSQVVSEPTLIHEEKERIKWFDHEDHTLFDVCADDHCQRYQGITRAYTAQVQQAVRDTCGEVLKYGALLCDARFSKCCGGVLEQFSTCWEDCNTPYLIGKRDWINAFPHSEALLPDLTTEEGARRWICSAPSAFCGVREKKVLAQVLNNYDQETPDFYRWKVIYSSQRLSELLSRKLEIDFGTILELVPLQRGVSGRISRLRIVGSMRTMVIGKELLIRSALSDSHLYSSAFVVDREGDTFVFRGAGWGHGVGLCQIGAAVMSEQGYNYKEILQHYYVGATIEKMEYSR